MVVHLAVALHAAPAAGALTDAELDLLFHALADVTRRDILQRTLAGDRSITELAGAYTMTFAAVQKHVAVLAAAGLVRKERHGREQLVRAAPEVIKRANDALLRYEALWRERDAGIQNLLDGDAASTAQANTRDGERQ